MSDRQHSLRQWALDEIAARPHGTKSKLADYMGLRPDAITRMLNTQPGKEARQIKADEMQRMKEFFALNPIDDGGIVAPDAGYTRVPVMGYVGAGAEVDPDFEQVPPGGMEQVDVPLAMPADLIAFQVRGDSMLPMFEDGMVIIVYRDQRRSAESFIGDRVIVRTTDGRRYVKTLLRGSSEGRFNLMSWNARLIENVEVAWIGEIFTFFPASSVRREAARAAKRGGLQGSLNLRAG